MSHYSFSLTTFNPSGKLLQIEYALNAVSQGGTSLSIKASNGIVLVSERRPPTPLIVAEEIHKIFPLDEHIGCAYSGVGPDARLLISQARKACQTYRLTYGEGIPVRRLVREVALIMQEYTQSGGVRPFGCSLLIAGHDAMGPQLLQVDPSGSYFAWKATVIGRNATNAKSYLEKRYTNNIEREDAIHMALLTLKETFDGKMTSENIEVGVLDGQGNFRILTPQDVADYLDEVL